MIFDKVKKFFKRNKSSSDGNLIDKAKKSENTNEGKSNSIGDDTLGNVSGGVDRRGTYDPDR